MDKPISLTPRGKDPRKVWAKSVYDSARWRRVRDQVLAAEPLCRRCGAEAVYVHHILELLVRPDLAFTLSNLEPLCGTCHTTHHKGRKPWG